MTKIIDIIIPDLGRSFERNIDISMWKTAIETIIKNSEINGITEDMIDFLDFYDKDGKRLVPGSTLSGSKIYIKLNADNYFIDDIGGMKITNKKYIGNTKRFKNNYLTSQKRFEDSEMLLKSQKLQLILWSMVGGISVLCLLLILRKFSKKQ